MKYIRNESGIYEVVKSNNRSTEFIYPTKKGIRFCYRQNNKCKFADTIEELCDEFVIENNGHCISDLYTIRRLLVKNKVVVYGAIWTDKGLIYVAKMNDKGELELL